VGRARIGVPQEAIADFCRRHHIRKLACSAPSCGTTSIRPATSTFWLSSTPAMCRDWRFLNTPQSLSPYFRNQALAEAEYAAS